MRMRENKNDRENENQGDNAKDSKMIATKGLTTASA